MADDWEAVIFDFVGVLVHSEPLHFAAWQQAMTTLGVELAFDRYYHRFLGLEDRVAVRIVAEELEPPRSFDDLWPAFDLKQRLFLEKISAAPQVPESTRRIIARLRAEGYRIGVVTSSSGHEVEPLLISNGIRDYMDVCVFAESVSRKKPDPEPYLTAKQLLRVTRALVLEDSEAGMTSARAAGCDVIPVTNVEGVAKLIRERLGLL